MSARTSAPPPIDRLKEHARRAAVAAEAVETIAGMIDQLQQTATNFGASVDMRIEGEAISGRVVIGIDLAGVSARRDVTAAAASAPSEAKDVITFHHKPAAPASPAAPAPDPSPAVEERAGAPRPHVHDTRNLGANWSDDDDLCLLTKDESGLSMRELAAQLGRTVPSCWTRLQKLRRAERQEEDAPAPVADPAKLPPDHPVELSRADLRVAERLRMLPAIGGWDAARDLLLVERLTAGSKLPQVSKELDMPSTDCIARWHALCPAGGFDEQVQVLRVLRRIVAEDTE